MAEKKEECVQVVVRCRPFNKKEKEENRTDIISMDLEANSIIIRNPEDVNLQPKPFTYDAVYDANTIQKNFYEESCSALVENVLEGFNGTIFAYGQTGCGKTWTMQGPSSPPELKGVIPNSFTHIFDFVKASQGVEFLVRCSYLEIYNEVVKDLLADSKLKDPPKCDIKEDPSKGVFVTNLTDVIVEKEEEMDAVLNKGLHNRTVGSTLMNAESSRSHSIFTIVIEMNTKDPETGKDHIRAGKLNLVDLAGSERQKKTGASGDRLKEGSKINLSLSALGNVISALSEGGAKHIPYRDSKLTRLLQDSLGGNTKTLMVAAISPADYNYDETLSTLRYANRAKNIKNKPKINEDPKDTMLREYKEEIEKLRKMLAEQAEMLKGGDPTAFNAMMQMQANFAAAHPTVAQVTHTAAAAGETDGDDVDFASLGAVSESSKKKMSPRPPRSPRFDNEDVRSPRVIEKKVEVLVEKIPDEHLEHHRALENYSKAVEVERDKYGEQLRAAEEAAATEKQQRLDLENRLNDLQRKLMGQQESGHDASPGGAAPVASEDVNGEINLSNYQFPSEVVEDNSYTNGAQAPSQAAVVESEAVAKEREAALVRIRERKRKAKKKADAKLRAEKERALKESNDIQEELDDLKDVVADTSQSKEQTEKKLTRLRKKYERKVGALEADRTDLIEQFGIERNNMLDTIRDQQQDIKLYEQICRTLLSNKKMNQIIDKARWSEEDDEWTLPYFRGDGDGGDYGSSRLPDINKDAVVSPRAPSSGAPGIAFPRNVNSEAKNFSPSNSSLPPAFGKKQATSKSGDEDDGYSSGHNSDKKSRKHKERDGEFLQLPEFSNRTVLPSAGSAQASARSEYASREGRDNSPMEGEKKKKKKKKPYDETKAKQTLMDGDGQEENAGAISDWGFAGNNSQNEDTNGEKKRRNKSSSGNRKSKDLDSNHLPGINGASGRGDHSPRGYKNDSLPHI